jgi:L-histidine N-alpha-methyltransferase
MSNTSFPGYCFKEVAPVRQVSTLAEDVVNGLFSDLRSLSPKYFYDHTGSRLFDQICETPEYYPTRTEAALLREYAASIIDLVQPDHMVEFGSGTSRKTRYLLEAARRSGHTLAYWPFDICSSLLHDVARDLQSDFPGLEINAQCGDFTAGIAHLEQPHGRSLYLFLGGTIGNFDPADAQAFIAEIAAHMRPGDALLLGADRIKDTELLHAAYNDEQGLTAEFNLNLLSVLNRELDADFSPRQFRHEARYNAVDNQIEMYLVAERPQNIYFGQLDRVLELQQEELILTEISRKFSRESIRTLIETAGLVETAHYEPDNGWFSLMLAGKPCLSD